jgi:hypothetical protein
MKKGRYSEEQIIGVLKQMEAERRLRADAAKEFNEFLVLPFKATDAPPYPFEWVNYDETRLDYGAALSRISAIYQQRF